MSGIPAGAGSLLGKRLGKYEILALLALGGTAEIYLARIAGAAGFEKYVVVKCLHDHLADDQTFVKMFLDEARLAAALDHSNIVQTMELGEYENRYFMVLEFLAGLSLAMVVRRAGERLQGGRIPVQLVLNIVAQSCAGLHYAHERTQGGKPLNIVHRDISPQNLVISFEGVVKVVDFGIAKAEHRETKTQSGTIKGKFAYMSPEQCVAMNVDRRTDVFALGVIAHELLTGRRLFKKPSPYETYQAVIECDVKPPSAENVEIDPALDPIIMKALAKDKEHRYPTAEAFGDAIVGYLHHRGKGSGPNDVSRWFDEHFAQEIEEHGARMRELISGREIAPINWDVEEEGAKQQDKGNLTVDLGAKQNIGGEKSQTLDTADIIDARGSSSGLSDLIDDLGDGNRNDGDDDMPAERTRIEANPLEKLKELDLVNVPRTSTGKTPKPELGIKGQETKETPRPELVKNLAQQHKMPPSGPLPLPAPPTGPHAPARRVITPPGTPKAASGKFPDLSNLPTMIAEPDPDTPPPPAGPSIAATRPTTGPSPAVARTTAPELAATAMAGEIVDAGRPSAQMDAMMSMDAPTVLQSHSSSGPMPSSESQQAPPSSQQMARQSMQQLQQAGRPSNLPLSYPVMDRELRGQMASGATVFPSDSQRAANLASPVGAQYGNEVDWSQAAALPARAIPPWLLGVIFVAAIGVALVVTIIIAKLVR
jgi:tRNA A-37 threonylcarbamoyl transferase component Bud32